MMKTLKLVLFLLVTAASVSFLATTTLAAPFANGSFESPALAAPGRDPIANLNDWTGVGGFMLLERGINGVSNVPAFDGDQFVSFGHSGAANDRLFQSFDTVAEQTYAVDFFITSIQGAASQTMRASAFDDTNNNLLGFTDSMANLQNTWIPGTSLVFSATSSTTRLEFEHTVGSSFANLALDAVTVVPEPSGVTILLTLSTLAFVVLQRTLVSRLTNCRSPATRPR